MTIDLTNNEASTICYALNELANKRQEQAFERRDSDLIDEAQRIRQLSRRISDIHRLTKPA